MDRRSDFNMQAGIGSGRSRVFVDERQRREGGKKGIRRRLRQVPVLLFLGGDMFCGTLGRVERSFCLPPGDDAAAISNCGVAVACDARINASGGTAGENRTPAGGRGTTSRARTEWIIGTLEASKRQATAAFPASCWRVGFDHHDLFLISGAAGCVRARASGYRAEASSSQEAKRPPGSLARHRVTMRSSAGGTAGLCRDGGSGSAFRICAQTAPMELPSKGRAPVSI